MPNHFAPSMTFEPPMAEVVELDYAPPEPRVRRRWILILAWLAAVTTLLGTLLIYVEVETVIGSGPALAGLGLVLLTLGLMRRSPGACLLGALHIAVCLLFFGLVFFNSWGPRQAEVPFRILSPAYCAFILFLTTAFTWLDRRPDVLR